MFYFRMPFDLFHTDVVVLSPDLAPLVTALWVVLMTNAINLIDGLDGLAAGIVAIAGRRALPVRRPAVQGRLLDGANIAPLVAIIAVGVCVGFLPFNLNPARIIMGDAGALFLGLLLAVPTITIGGRTDFAFSGSTYFFFAPLLIPIVILGVPILDTVFSFVRRMLSRQTLSVGRRRHLHHRLMRLGHGPAAHGRDPLALDRAALGRRARARPTRTRATRSCRSRRGALAPRLSTSCSTRASASAAGAARTGAAPDRAEVDGARRPSDVVDLDERRRDEPERRQRGGRDPSGIVR